MSAISNFAFEEHLVRVVERDGEPWFVGNDVCRALDLANARDAMSNLDDDERVTINLNTVGISDGIRGNPNVVIISEPGVYRLVFRSRKPEAERFKRWLAHEVIPAIRKTGRYGAAEAPTGAPALDTEAPLMARVAAVRLAASLFGKARARTLWNDMGLPHVPEPPQEPVGISDEAAIENGLSCLNFLLNQLIAGNRISDIIMDADAGTEDARLLLRRVGIRYEGTMFEDTAGFCIATRSPTLAKCYVNTLWDAYGWAPALRKLPGARNPTRRLMKFDKGFTSQSVFLPMHYVAPPYEERN